MTAHDLARTAYSKSTPSIRTPRASEYDALAHVTGQLRSATTEGRTSVARLAAALHDNRLLWTTLAADVAGPGNGLPEELRARIFYLAEFTQQHSPRVLRGEAAADILVDINTAVMRGLRQGEAVG